MLSTGRIHNPEIHPSSCHSDIQELELTVKQTVSAVRWGDVRVSYLPADPVMASFVEVRSEFMGNISEDDAPRPFVHCGVGKGII